MILKIQAIKIKVSLHRLYIYYKQLLHIIYIICSFEKTMYILVNNQINTGTFLHINEIFSTFGLSYKYFKFSLNIYNYLLKNNFFKFYYLKI